MQPTHDQIQTDAYHQWQERGGEHGFDLADWLASENYLTLKLNYDTYPTFSLNGPIRTYFGCKVNRQCRYCGRTSKTVKFKNEAHAIPHLTGNRCLFSYDECDECNKFFSETIDDSFGKMLLPMRTLHWVSGKTGVPAFKTRDKTARVDVDKANMHLSITDHGVSPLFIQNTEEKSLSANLETQPYIPILVYKCLVKMALAIMPVEELKNFTHTLKWLLERDPTWNLHRVRSAACYIYDFLVPLPASVMLMRRRTLDTPLPYMLFVLFVGRLAFQTYLPLTPMDNCFAGMPITFPQLSSLVIPGWGESHRVAMSLASTKVVSDTFVDVVLSYESCHKTTKPS